MTRAALSTLSPLLVAGLLTGATAPPPSDSGAPAQSTPAGRAPQPGTPEYYGDWAVGCDNVLRCEAVSLMPENAARGHALVLQIVRAGGPGGELGLRAKAPEPLPARLRLLVDGREVARLTARRGEDPLTEGQAALAAIRAMGNAVTVEVAGKRKKVILATPSTRGLPDALRAMDARQGRTGTVSALLAGGSRPDAAVPPAPEAPVVPQIAAPAADSAAVLSDAELAAALSLAKCDARLMAQAVKELVPLDRNTALLLLPCEAGAYNVSAVPLIARGPAGTRSLSIARFDYAPGFTGEPGTPPLVVNALWDARRGVLSSLAKGRGAGDCGASEDYVWDGTMFRLIESRAMQLCRGAWDWIRLWTATPRKVDTAPVAALDRRD